MRCYVCGKSRTPGDPCQCTGLQAVSPAMMKGVAIGCLLQLIVGVIVVLAIMYERLSH